MFQDSSNGIEDYTTSVISFINKCIDDVVPTVTVRTYPNQKPWITGNIRIKLKASAVDFNDGTLFRTLVRNPAMPSDEPSNRQSQYRIKIESYYTGSDARRMWQCLKTIMDYKGKPRRKLPSDAR